MPVASPPGRLIKFWEFYLALLPKLCYNTTILNKGVR